MAIVNLVERRPLLGAARDQAHVGADQLAGDPITAATRGKQFDDLVVRQGDDEHRHRSRDCHIQAEMGMVAQRPEGFFRTICR